MFELREELNSSFFDGLKQGFGFVDADNIRRGFEQLIERSLAPEKIKDAVSFEGIFHSFPLKRFFLYSAVESGSTPHSWIESLRSQNGFVFRGSLLKQEGKKRKQEGVDVRLAVEAMQLAYRNKLSHAVIFSGDGDLLPLVNALVDEGVLTTVVSFGNPSKSDVASRFKDACDAYIQLDREKISQCLFSSFKPYHSGQLNKKNTKKWYPKCTLAHELGGKFELASGPQPGDYAVLPPSFDEIERPNCHLFTSEEAAITWASLVYS